MYLYSKQLYNFFFKINILLKYKGLKCEVTFWNQLLLRNHQPPLIVLCTESIRPMISCKIFLMWIKDKHVSKIILILKFFFLVLRVLFPDKVRLLTLFLTESVFTWSVSESTSRILLAWTEYFKPFTSFDNSSSAAIWKINSLYSMEQTIPNW